MYTSEHTLPINHRKKNQLIISNLKQDPRTIHVQNRIKGHHLYTDDRQNKNFHEQVEIHENI